MIRPKAWGSLNTVMYFVTRTFASVLSVLWRFICSYDFTLAMNRGLISLTCLGGRKSSSFAAATIPLSSYRIQHKTSPLKPHFSIIVSISRVGHISGERQAVSWVRRLMFPMHKSDGWGIGIRLAWPGIILLALRGRQLACLLDMEVRLG